LHDTVFCTYVIPYRLTWYPLVVFWMSGVLSVVHDCTSLVPLVFSGQYLVSFQAAFGRP